MAIRKLPAELISLVHHVTLNESGWWKKSIRKMIIAVVWLARKPLTNQEILESLQSNFGIFIDIATVTSQVIVLCSEKTLVSISSKAGQVKVSEEHLREFESGLKSSIEEGNQAKAQFSILINSYCADLNGDDVWEDFNNNFLLPLIKELGANAYKLVSGESRVEDGSYLDKFIEKYDEIHRAGLRYALVQFLNPKNLFTRSYILSNLNVYFLVEAAGIPSKTLAAIEKSQKGKPKFRLFLDTNTLFSILELHDNPSDAAAVTLLDLANSLKGQVELKLYVLPETVDETKRVIAAVANYLDNVGVPQNVASAIPHIKSSGILMKYLDEAKRSPERIQPKDYFAPYINDLKTMLHGNGIEVYGAPLLHMHQRQDVVDDTLAQLKHEEVKPEARRKSYEAIQHDVTLWHVVNDTRPQVLESPLDANDWVVTLDYSLLGFDRFKQHTNGSKIPVCILPVSLTQMLQFWVPRSQDVEDSILSSIQLPLLFHEFSEEDEKTTLRIVQAISRYQNAEDIPVESVQAILVNGALRARIAEDISDDDQIRLVRDALVEQHAEINLKLNQTEERVSQLETENKVKNSKITSLASEGDEFRAQLEKKETELEASKAEAAMQAKKFIEHQELLYFKELVIYLPIILWFILSISVYWVMSQGKGNLVWYALLASSLIFVVCWIVFALYVGKGKRAVEALPVFKVIKKIRKYLYWGIGVVATWSLKQTLDLYSDAFHQAIKYLLG